MHCACSVNTYISKAHAACDPINGEFVISYVEELLSICDQCPVTLYIFDSFDSINCSNNHVYKSNDNYMQKDECLEL